MRVQSLEATNTDYIHLYYNNAVASDAQNAAGVWDANYRGVWHLDEQVTDEQTSGAYADSTGVHDGTQVNTDDYQGEGRYAQDFDGTGDLVNVADADSLSFGNGGTDSAFTLSAWIKGETDTASILEKNYDPVK